MSKRKKQNRTVISEEAKKTKNGVAVLFLFVLWAVVCVAVYYYSIVQKLNYFIHIYVWISIPTLVAAVLINGYFNAKYGEESGRQAPRELVLKMKKTVKTCVFIGLPPISCVFIEYLAGWIKDKV